MFVSHFAIIFRSYSGSIPTSHRSRSPLRSLFGHENISRCLNEIKWRLSLNIYLQDYSHSIVAGGFEEMS